MVGARRRHKKKGSCGVGTLACQGVWAHVPTCTGGPCVGRRLVQRARDSRAVAEGARAAGRGECGLRGGHV